MLLQDTATYDSKQKSVGGQVTIGAGASASGSFAKSNIESDYASVNEQSGIIAGDGGYTVEVANHTNLTGGIITSTVNTEDNGLNSFTTATLTASDIQNHAHYEGDSIGVSGGVSIGESGSAKPDKNGNPTGVFGSDRTLGVSKSIGYGSEGESQTSTTYSGINTTNLTIHNQAQSNTRPTDIHTSTTTDTLAQNSGALANTFDAEAVQNELDVQVRVTQEFNQNAHQIVDTYITDKTKESRDNAKKAAASEDGLYEGKTAQEWNESANSWSGEKAAAANIIIAAIVGNPDALNTVLAREGLRYMATEFREIMIEDSKKFKGLISTDGKILNNAMGESVGVNGDEFKLAGGRWNLERLEKIGAITKDETGTTPSGYIEDENGYVVLNTSQDAFLSNPDIINDRSPMGGYQGSGGLFAFWDYGSGDFRDRLAESYAGTHDFFNSFIWYDDLGNIRSDINPALEKVGDVTNYTNVLLATPFAMSELFDVQTWEIVNAVLEMQ